VITGTAVAAVLAVVLLIPFPLRVRCPVHIEPQQGTDVKVTSPGVVEHVAVAVGDTVHAGETLVTLSNPDLELEMADLKLRKEHQQLIVEGYEAQRQIAEAESARDVLESLEKQIEEKQRQLDKLHVVAPHDGVVIPPPYKPPPDPLQRPRMLTGWYGTPLEPRNHGVYLDSGAWVCTVAPPGKAKAELVIDQGDIEYVRKRQKGKPTKVRLKLDELQEETLEGEIAELAKVEVLVAPPELTNKAGGEVPTEPGPGGMERPAGAFYYAAVLLDDPDGLLRPGFRGRAKIEAGKRTYGQWLWRWISDTYRFRL
jgi:putative peptide zinc metalloprotease protein